MRTPRTLAGLLRAEGHLDDGWYETVAGLDRGAFVPDRIWLRGNDGYRPVTRTAQPERWREAVYTDTAVVTQVADPDRVPARRPTSSASMPRMVTRMLAALDVEDGQRVLEVGTGTGYNAALLAARLGDAQVTSVEYDPDLADQARAALKRAGYSPKVVTGDGGRGVPGGTPYDRVVATYSMHRIPLPLVAQTRPGGVIVLPWGTGLYNGVLLRLAVQDDGTASGPVIDDSAFMWDRTQEPDRDVMAVVNADAARARTSRSDLDPRSLLGDPDMAFVAGVLVPGTRYSVGHADDGSGEFTVWLADAGTASWAAADYEPGATDFAIEEHGPRRLWDEAAAAYAWWRGSGSPERTRFGVTVTPGGRHVWLDAPEHTVD
ncbi:MAG: methyltransferase domain-containing protein [Streptomyces sp.]|uniref:methyltransferase domain-containing protein n=1 Tax=Streptomyces sp. TaxID=1931 RepID=UPI003D6BE77E